MSPTQPSTPPPPAPEASQPPEGPISAALCDRWQGWISHEWGLVVVGGVIAMGLVFRAGVGHPVTWEVWIAITAYAGSIQALCMGIARLRSLQPPQRTWRKTLFVPKRLVQLRLLLAYGYTLWLFGAFTRIIPAWGRAPMDAALLTADRWLFGETPSALWAGHAGLTIWLSGAYLSYLIYLHVALAHYSLRLRDRVVWIWRYVFWTYCIGFVGYLCVPALGPQKAYPSLYQAALPGMSHWLSQINHAIVSRGSGVYDVFPSLHVLITCVLLHVDWHHCRRRFWIALPLSLPLFASTLYLRYHYAIDLMAGFALFALLAWWFQRDLRSDI